ncbi:hypothetical protein [Streptomyces atratus]|uniref:hypothetical protein n=1 Tax=Streptomyces atratus TaxID=1893 RepID=UPI002B1E5F23|nr:hypothetical protein [Streptomyces atratus]
MQAKLHRWTVADPGHRFDDLFNFVHDLATLLAAFDRVAGNRGARATGVDCLTAMDVEESIGVPGFLNDLRAAPKDGSFCPLPVRERSIPKPGGSGRVRKLGIPTIADRVVQATLKLVLKPISEADFKPLSYGFRPRVSADKSNKDPPYQQAQRECGGYDTCVTERTRKLREQNAKTATTKSRTKEDPKPSKRDDTETTEAKEPHKNTTAGKKVTNLGKPL